jgi:hypothetical protein
MSGFKSYFASSFFAAAALTVVACSAAPDDGAGSESSAASAAPNLCVGQAGNTFHCLDATRFELCTGFQNRFVIESCPPGLCATRHPANENPCVGAARATQIDGVPPTPPGQVDGSGGASAGGTSNAGSGSGGSGNTGGTTSGGGQTSGGNTGGNGTTCVGGPKFDPAGAKNVGNGAAKQFIGGQCLDTADCASGCCAKPCGICSGTGAQFQAGKQGCGFGG